MTERVFGGVTASVVGPHHTTKCVIITLPHGRLRLLHLFFNPRFKFTSVCINNFVYGKERRMNYETRPPPESLVWTLKRNEWRKNVYINRHPLAYCSRRRKAVSYFNYLSREEETKWNETTTISFFTLFYSQGCDASIFPPRRLL